MFKAVVKSVEVAPLKLLDCLIISSASAGPAKGAQKLAFWSVRALAVALAVVPICVVRAVISSVALTVVPVFGFSIFPVKTGTPASEKTILSCLHCVKLAIWVATSFSGTVALSLSAIQFTSSFDTSGRPSCIFLFNR